MDFTKTVRLGVNDSGNVYCQIKWQNGCKIDVPDEVIAYLTDLPETDKTPAWV